MELYTVKEVAQMLKVSIMTIRTYIKCDQLAIIRVGRNVRISKEELERFIQEGTTPDYNERLKAYLNRSK